MALNFPPLSSHLGWSGGTYPPNLLTCIAEKTAQKVGPKPFTKIHHFVSGLLTGFHPKVFTMHTFHTEFTCKCFGKVLASSAAGVLLGSPGENVAKVGTISPLPYQPLLGKLHYRASINSLVRQTVYTSSLH